MGTGEPFDNYDSLGTFLRILHHPDGKNMSYRNMDRIHMRYNSGHGEIFGGFSPGHLAVSLHSLRDEERSRIMPVNRAYPLKRLLEAARAYTERTGRRITFEYALIKGKNDTEGDVELMKKSLGSINCHVNLIPLNRVDETGLLGSGRKRAAEIAGELEASGIAATVRRELGVNIDGACGQLRLKETENG